MKIKYADMRNNKNILESEFKMKNITNENFTGTVTIINFKEITNSVSVTRPDNSKDCLLDLEYKWIGIYPKDKKYCITIMYDNYWNLLQWYFDIIKDTCNYEDGVPYVDDLYLDIVVLPTGKYYMLDEDELEKALSENVISKKEYDMAYAVAKDISKMLDYKFNELVEFTNYCVETLNT